MIGRRNRRTALAAVLALAISFAAPAADTAPKRTLKAFASEAELAALFKGWQEQYRRRQAEARARPDAPVLGAASKATPLAAAPAAEESVTNVQHAGVDEGGIVKLHGDHLVILRRGRLFTVRVGDRGLAPVSVADAFGDGIDPRGAWYDEMLLWKDTIAVIGYSYARGGTEIGLFRISPEGILTHRSTWHLRSNDYYSSRNYASRLIGSKLVFYAPLHLNPWAGDPYASFPAVRRWRHGAASSEFRRIAPATRIYRTDEPLDPWQGVALHSVTTCDLAAPELDCASTAVLALPGRVFYVSPESVYVWTTAWRRLGARTSPVSSVFRIPLEGSAPSALKTAGSPIDQFSFLEGADGFLNVLVRAEGSGEGMWAAESRAGDLALLRVPLARFSYGTESARPEAYRPLPRPAGSYALHNRFVGDYLLYGSGAGWRRPAQVNESKAYAVRYAGEGNAHDIPLVHGVDRIEALGAHALVIGSDGRDLHFTSVRLGSVPVAVERYTRANAAQGETRSHGFSYRPQDPYEGLIGLPNVGGGEAASRQLRRESASVLYLRNRALTLTELGTLDSRSASGGDGCRASCVDWYGNSRPLFVRDRVFALMGYEIVEGRLRGERIEEAARVSFAPGTAPTSR